MNDKYWMSIVDKIAEASTCRVNIGALLIQNNYMVGVGYVGSVSSDVHCKDEGCLLLPNHGLKGSGKNDHSCERTIHAEVNAILKCSVRGNARDGWLTCYSTYSPCLNCTKLLLQIGVSNFVYKKDYRDIYRDEYIDNVQVNRLLSWKSI